MKPALFSAAILAISATAHAATVTGSYTAAPNATPETSYLLPSGTDTDWGYFNQAGSPTVAVTSYNANNTSSTGPRTFTASVLNGGNVRGPADIVKGAPFSYFDFTNGDPTISGTDIRPSGIFNSVLGASGVTAGAGIQTTLTGFTTQSLISVWVYNFSAKGTFDVFINGTLSYTETVAIPTANPTDGKAGYLFSLNFTPDSASDSVNIQYRMTDRLETDGNAHVGLQAIAISPIPEPASLALLALGASSFGLRRRRI